MTHATAKTATIAALAMLMLAGASADDRGNIDEDNCPHPNWVADGICDMINNVAGCNFDGGDCCENTCRQLVHVRNMCGVNGYHCVDPFGGDLGGCRRPATAGDGICNEINNVDNCWDGGDCCQETCERGPNYFRCGMSGFHCLDPDYAAPLGDCPFPTLPGDKVCQTETNIKECGWDGGDCCRTTCKHCPHHQEYNCKDPEVKAQCPLPLSKADGICDMKNNNRECGFDGGDCCQASCYRGLFPGNCGSRGYFCSDPEWSSKHDYFLDLETQGHASGASDEYKFIIRALNGQIGPDGISRVYIAFDRDFEENGGLFSAPKSSVTSNGTEVETVNILNGDHQTFEVIFNGTVFENEIEITMPVILPAQELDTMYTFSIYVTVGESSAFLYLGSVKSLVIVNRAVTEKGAISKASLASETTTSHAGHDAQYTFFATLPEHPLRIEVVSVQITYPAEHAGLMHSSTMMPPAIVIDQTPIAYSKMTHFPDRNSYVFEFRSGTFWVGTLQIVFDVSNPVNPGQYVFEGQISTSELSNYYIGEWEVEVEEPVHPIVYNLKLVNDTPYYILGPQQASEADGIAEAGTRLRVVREKGSYSLVVMDSELMVYLATDSYEPLELNDEEEERYRYWQLHKCDDHTMRLCNIIIECKEGLLEAVRDNCVVCVDPRTCAVA